MSDVVIQILQTWIVISAATFLLADFGLRLHRQAVSQQSGLEITAGASAVLTGAGVAVLALVSIWA